MLASCRLAHDAKLAIIRRKLSNNTTELSARRAAPVGPVFGTVGREQNF